jgi:predicted metalloprotease with PDZ domain
MNKLILVFYALVFSGCGQVERDDPKYLYTVNLEKVENNRLFVDLKFTGSLQDTSYFCFPKIVPGIYDDLNYGKFIHDFKAIDKNGQSLDVRQTDENCREITGTKDLAGISYTVTGGWEKFDFEGIRPYRSSESYFDSSVVILNANSVFGYFSYQENIPFRINIKKPEEFYGATSLPRVKSSKKEDHFIAGNYRTLVDNPIMYSCPDTASIHLPDISVHVACFSGSEKKIAKELTEYITPLVKNQTDYLGGKPATDKYTFILYHNLNDENTRYFADGLEHSQSTLILTYAPFDMEILKSIVFGLASHEFFHTQVPLGLHSDEIANFNFNRPEFSKHLWLYEGMTEYFTIHMPIKQKMQTPGEFVQVVERKISGMKKFNQTYSFTEMSRNIMEMPDEYMNVYFKGPLINLCLDIQLRELSNGTYGVQNLVSDLMNKYGKDKPFHDDDLFNDIYTITGYPEIKTFVENYIEGNQDLPLKAELQKVGLALDNKTGKITESTPLTEKQKILRKHWINQ